jgi:SAM-dependent methyltransferase
MSHLWRCRACDLIYRDSDYTVGASSQSLDHAFYVLPEYEVSIMKCKKGVFRHLVCDLTDRFGPDVHPRRVVDFGCSYGHLGKTFQAAGWQVTGIDRAPGILTYHRQQGTFPVYADLDVPEIADGTVDAIMMVDVIYYLQDPVGVLRVAHRKLATPGVVVLRVPNRNKYLRLAALVQRIRGNDYVRRVEVDHKSYWSVRSVHVAAQKAGFNRVRILRREHGYGYPWPRKMFHWGTQMLSHATCGLLDAATVFYAELWKQ